MTVASDCGSSTRYIKCCLSKSAALFYIAKNNLANMSHNEQHTSDSALEHSQTHCVFWLMETALANDTVTLFGPARSFGALNDKVVEILQYDNSKAGTHEEWASYFRNARHGGNTDNMKVKGDYFKGKAGDRRELEVWRQVSEIDLPLSTKLFTLVSVRLAGSRQHVERDIKVTRIAVDSASSPDTAAAATTTDNANKITDPQKTPSVSVDSKETSTFIDFGGSFPSLGLACTFVNKRYADEYEVDRFKKQEWKNEGNGLVTLSGSQTTWKVKYFILITELGSS